ncbi:MAG TPA: toxin-antitoxin system HicB family antitoxin [Acidimicrobiales bacterium]|nr:toxin-antitoxin system HicB family antitoxin [Acidimicrobiales bacterium]
MRISELVETIAADLASLGALGDDATAGAARRLAAAMQGPVTARLLDGLGQLADELGASLPDHSVELRLAGGSVQLVVVAKVHDEAPEPETEGEADARITLRLSGQLKARVELASAREGVSVNTYIVRALSQQSRSDWAAKGRRRLTGYGRG